MDIRNEFFGKIIDVHTHIFPEKIAVKATNAVGAFYDLSMSSVGTKDVLIDEMNKNGVKHCFIHSVATVPQQVRAINDFLAETMKSDSDKFTAFGPIHIGINNILDEIDYMKTTELQVLSYTMTSKNLQSMIGH